MDAAILFEMHAYFGTEAKMSFSGAIVMQVNESMPFAYRDLRRRTHRQQHSSASHVVVQQSTSFATAVWVDLHVF
jgi:hypothetical protein